MVRKLIAVLLFGLALLAFAPNVIAQTVEERAPLRTTLVLWSGPMKLYSYERLPVTPKTVFCHGSVYPSNMKVAEFWCKELGGDGSTRDYFFLFTKPERS